MNKYINRSLLVNASSLGYHWIYDQELLSNLAKTRNMLLSKANEEIYKLAKVSYFAYPNHELGMVTFQGMFLVWLFHALKNDPNFNQKQYSELIYNHIKPGGSYQGYIESYGKKLIFNHLIDELKLKVDKITIEDDHLVGFMPYIACKELKLSNDKAFELTSLFTKNNNYKLMFNVFDYIIDNMTNKNKKAVLNKSIELAPLEFKNKLEMAVTMTDTNDFINKYSGTSCSIDLSIPLIFHLISQTNSYKELLEKNILLGGSSSDRGLILGLLTRNIYDVDKDLELELIL